MKFINTQYNELLKVDSISAIEFRDWSTDKEIIIVLENGREYVYSCCSDELDFMKKQSKLMDLLRTAGLEIISPVKEAK